MAGSMIVLDKQIIEVMDDENIVNWKPPFYMVDIREYLAFKFYYGMD
jgi:hypothetical protein